MLPLNSNYSFSKHLQGRLCNRMVIMHNVLLITKQLSISLQQVNIDLTRCWREIQLVVDVITQMHNVDVKVNFGKIFNEAENLLAASAMPLNFHVHVLVRHIEEMQET